LTEPEKEPDSTDEKSAGSPPGDPAAKSSYPPLVTKLIWLIGIGTLVVGALSPFFDAGTKAITKGGELIVAIESQFSRLWSPGKELGDMTWEEKKKWEQEHVQ
jgi:hypothetical protein